MQEFSSFCASVASGNLVALYSVAADEGGHSTGQVESNSRYADTRALFGFKFAIDAIQRQSSVVVGGGEVAYGICRQVRMCIVYGEGRSGGGSASFSFRLRRSVLFCDAMFCDAM